MQDESSRRIYVSLGIHHRVHKVGVKIISTKFEIVYTVVFDCVEIS